MIQEETEDENEGDREVESELNLLSLPDVILYEVLSHLSVPELCRIGRVSKSLYQYTHDPVLWKVLDFSATNAKANDVHRLLQNAVRCEELTLSIGNAVDSAVLIEFPRVCGGTLRKLRVMFCKAMNIGALEHIVAHCNQLESVNFEGCDRLSLSAKTLNDLENGVDRNRSSPSDPSENVQMGCMLATLPYLTSVNLSHCVLVQNDELVSLVAALQSLERLNIDGILNARDSVVHAICNKHATTLTHLFLDGENLTAACAVPLGSCTRLRALGISFAQQFEDSSMHHFNRLRTLEMLRLRKLTSVTQGGLFDLFADGRLGRLRHFEVTECQAFSNNSVSSLVSCSGSQLEVLMLSWAFEIDDAGVRAIVHGCRQLRRLDLSGLFRIVGHVFAEAHELLPSLTFLNLEQCNAVDDRLLHSLVEAKADLCVVDYYGEQMGNQHVKRTMISEFESF